MRSEEIKRGFKEIMLLLSNLLSYLFNQIRICNRPTDPRRTNRSRGVSVPDGPASCDAPLRWLAMSNRHVIRRRHANLDLPNRRSLGPNVCLAR